MSIRNRIKAHRRVKAGDLVPHELNFRTHPEAQRAALEAIYQEVGFARSLLAYETPDGRLKLIDGHLRRDIDPNMEVEVEVLDVTEDEARALLLSIDPLAGLAQAQEEIHQRLVEITPTRAKELAAVWQGEIERQLAELAEKKKMKSAKLGPEQFLVLITCRDEPHQVEVLERLAAGGLDCRALLA